MLYHKNVTPGIGKGTSRISMNGGGCGYFGPAMPVYRKNTTWSDHFHAQFYNLLGWLRIFWSSHAVLAFLLLMLLVSCARVRICPPSAPLTRQQIGQIISQARGQDRRVESFFSSGRLKVKGTDFEFNADILLVGTKNPFKIKLEITHWWGRPLFHILICGTMVQIVSYQERRCYIEHLGSPGISGLFPAELKPDQIWGLARGYPVIEGYSKVISRQEDQFLLLTADGNKNQSVKISPGNNLPCLVTLPDQGIGISFHDYKEVSGIYYAEKIEVNYPKADVTWAIAIRQASFNRHIPEAVFQLEIPPDFEIVSSP